jgi:aspartate 1-decarboxylase
MQLSMFKSKIHRATVTQADLNYAGSLTLDPDLMEAAEMFVFERVQVLNVDTGARFETYIIEGERGSGTVCLNGPAARLGQVGDTIIALTYCQVDKDEAKDWEPVVVHVDANNRVTDIDHDVD